MTIVSHPTNANYRDNFDDTFGKKIEAEEIDDTLVEEAQEDVKSEETP
jgi:hypothetical protein